MRIYVLGNEDCVLGFSLAGVEGQAVRQPEGLRDALDRALADGTIGLLLISHDVADWERERVDLLKVTSLAPLVVEIPGAEDAPGKAPSLREFVQRAVGVRLGG